MQVYELPARAGGCSVTLAVDDIDAQARQLERLGLYASQRTDSAKVRTIMLTDPSGNHIAFAQAIDPSIAR